MTASSNHKERPAGIRGTTEKKSRQYQQQPGLYPIHAAGAHAAPHLTNEDATPGAGVLTNRAHDGREVDGAAG